MAWKASEASLRFMGLNSVGVDERNGSENQIQNPKAFVLIAFDTLVIAKNRDAVGKRIPINVGESGTKERNCSVNVDVWDVDVDGKSGCG